MPCYYKGWSTSFFSEWNLGFFLMAAMGRVLGVVWVVSVHADLPDVQNLKGNFALVKLLGRVKNPHSRASPAQRLPAFFDSHPAVVYKVSGLPLRCSATQKHQLLWPTQPLLPLQPPPLRRPSVSYARTRDRDSQLTPHSCRDQDRAGAQGFRQ